MTTRDYDRVQRWSSILVGLAAVALAGVLALGQVDMPVRSLPEDAGTGDAALDPAAVTAAAPPEAEAGAGEALEPAPDAGLGAFSLSFDASDLPSSGGPRSVKVGVVLVQWQGAEGASTSTRSKTDALAKATELAAQAKAEFRRAVTQGDPGSAEDIGRIPRGTLDARTEAALFNMTAGDVSDVIETPRGYWIVKRIE